MDPPALGGGENGNQGGPEGEAQLPPSAPIQGSAPHKGAGPGNPMPPTKAEALAAKVVSEQEVGALRAQRKLQSPGVPRRAARGKEPTAVRPPVQRNLFNSLGHLAETAGTAVSRLAFPLLLILMVVAFLLIQGELDRRDPKLAAAPVDSRLDMVVFE